MLEIYMEKIRDLLSQGSKHKADLKVRQHPKTGFYVDGLSWVPVANGEDMIRWLNMGNETRTTGATAMNNTSSRSHAVFQVRVTQTNVDLAAGTARDTKSLLNLIDLAGR
jgi:kinesin family protein 13